MMSQTGYQIFTIHILPNVTKSKSNYAVKFSKLIKYSEKNVFLQRLCRKWGRETSSDLFLFAKKAISKVKAGGQHLIVYFGRPRFAHTTTTNFIKFQMVDPEIWYFPTFCVQFFKNCHNMLLLLCCINWPNFIFWLSLLFEMLSNKYIVVICCSVCDVMNFEIKHSFVI